MPLLDHFHLPVRELGEWPDFHSTWAGELKARLNERVLGPACVAMVQVRLGRAYEADLGTLTIAGFDADDDGQFPASSDNFGGGGTAVAVAPSAAPVWAPPVVELEADTEFPDDFEVRVYNTSAGRTLVGAIELVSPANKDRPEARRAFAAKVVSYLHRKVGVVVVDIVTSRLPNLHDAVCDELGLGPPFPFAADPTTYAVAYRPVRREEAGEFRDRIQMWRYPLTVGGPLPTMPLGLRNLGIVPVELDLTYTTACVRSRLPTG
jgi:hypothetical protein